MTAEHLGLAIGIAMVKKQTSRHPSCNTVLSPSGGSIGYSAGRWRALMHWTTVQCALFCPISAFHQCSLWRGIGCVVKFYSFRMALYRSSLTPSLTCRQCGGVGQCQLHGECRHCHLCCWVCCCKKRRLGGALSSPTVFPIFLSGTEDGALIRCLVNFEHWLGHTHTTQDISRSRRAFFANILGRDIFSQHADGDTGTPEASVRPSTGAPEASVHFWKQRIKGDCLMKKTEGRNLNLNLSCRKNHQI
jgi:hypothetical protein